MADDKKTDAQKLEERLKKTVDVFISRSTKEDIVKLEKIEPLTQEKKDAIKADNNAMFNKQLKTMLDMAKGHEGLALEYLDIIKQSERDNRIDGQEKDTTKKAREAKKAQLVTALKTANKPVAKITDFMGTVDIYGRMEFHHKGAKDHENHPHEPMSVENAEEKMTALTEHAVQRQVQGSMSIALEQYQKTKGQPGSTIPHEVATPGPKSVA